MTPVELSRTVLHAVRCAVDAGELRVAVPERVKVERPGPGGRGDYATPVAMQLARPTGLPPRQVAEILRRRLRAAPGIASVDISGPGFLNVTLGEGAYAVVTEILRGRDVPQERVADDECALIRHRTTSPPPRTTTQGSHKRTAPSARAPSQQCASFFEPSAPQGQRPSTSSSSAAAADFPAASRRPSAPHGLAAAGESTAPRYGHLASAPGLPVTLRVADDLRAAVVGDAVVRIMRAQGETPRLVRVAAPDPAWQPLGIDPGSDAHAGTLVGGSPRVLGTGFDGDAPADALADADPAHHVPAHHVPAEHVPTDHARVDDVSAHDVSIDDATIDEAPTDVPRTYPGHGRATARPAPAVSRIHPVPAPADPLPLGRDAARWALLHPAAHDRPRITGEHLVQRESNPLFRVRYAHARTRALARNAADLGFEAVPADLAVVSAAGAEAEAGAEVGGDLLAALVDYPVALRMAARHRAPDRLARYLVRLADAFLAFQETVSVLPVGDEKPSAVHRARLALAEAAGTVLADGLSLLGIHAPDTL